MKIKFLPMRKALSAALFVLLLNVVGMTKGYAYDFSAVCSTGQTLYYNITDATNHYVSMVAPAGNSTIGWNGYTKPAGNITLPSIVDHDGDTYTVTSIGNYAFYYCFDLTGSLTIPSTVTSIGESAFVQCFGFKGELVIPDAVTAINKRSFFECSGFTSLILGNSVTTIGENAFYRCTSLYGMLTIPNTVTSIGQFAFYDCRNLTSLTLGSSVTTIGNNAFADCNKLTSMIVLAETPPMLVNTTFTHVSTTIPVYVPCGSVDSYQWASVWSGFSNITGMCASGTITLAAEPAEGGSVTGEGTYECGTLCTVSAITNEGYTFMYWTENGTVVSTHEEYTFVVPTDRNLVAHFTLPFSVNAIADPIEGGTVMGGGDYDYGSTCTLTATSNENYIFMYWTKDDVRVSSQNTYSFTVTSECELVAHFTLPLSITAEVNPSDGGTVTGIGEYDYGSTCTLTAIPNEGYCFFYWVEDSIQLSSGPEYCFTVSEERHLVANFGLPLTVTTSVNLEEGGVATGAGMYDYESVCTLTATPNEGYLFLHWEQDGEVISCNSTYSFSVHEDVNVEAVFMPYDGAVIGGYDDAYSALPTKVEACYTMSQQIYTSDEIGGIGSITSLSFFNTGEGEFSGEVPEFPDPDDFTKTIGGNVRNIDVYMVHTDKSEFDDGMDWIAVTVADRVFSGEVTLTKGYWITLNFDTPFEYNGTSNLAVVFVDNSGTSSYFTTYCCVYQTQSYQAICLINNEVGFNPSYPYNYNGARYLMKNQFILNLSGYDITVTSGNEEAGSVSGSGQYAFGSICTLSATSNEGYNFVNWTKDGEVVSTEAVYSFIVTEEATYVANFEEAITTQTIEFVAGWNWFSTNLDLTLDNLKAALVYALGSTNITISSQNNGSTTYNGTIWRGTLNSLDVTQMYKIKTAADCEIVLTGTPFNPTEHPVTIHNGVNWIGFPLNVGMSLNDAFSGFAVSGDMIRSKDGSATYTNLWRGILNALVPGQGYIYKSNVTDDRILTFPTSAK